MHFETSIVRKPPPRHERLEHYITKEIDGASIGVEAQFVVTAEGGGQVDGGHGRRYIDGIDDVVVFVNDTEGEAGMVGLEGGNMTSNVQIWNRNWCF